MLVLRLRGLGSSDLATGAAPDDPAHCAIEVTATIGVEGQEGGENFSFLVVTPSALAEASPRWGRGLLLLPEFSWVEIERFVRRLLLHAARPTWQESAKELNKELLWEFDGYNS